MFFSTRKGCRGIAKRVSLSANSEKGIYREGSKTSFSLFLKLVSHPFLMVMVMEIVAISISITTLRC